MFVEQRLSVIVIRLGCQIMKQTCHCLPSTHSHIVSLLSYSSAHRESSKLDFKNPEVVNVLLAVKKTKPQNSCGPLWTDFKKPREHVVEMSCNSFFAIQRKQPLACESREASLRQRLEHMLTLKWGSYKVLLSSLIYITLKLALLSLWIMTPLGVAYKISDIYIKIQNRNKNRSYEIAMIYYHWWSPQHEELYWRTSALGKLRTTALNYIQMGWSQTIVEEKHSGQPNKRDILCKLWSSTGFTDHCNSEMNVHPFPLLERINREVTVRNYLGPRGRHWVNWHIYMQREKGIGTNVADAWNTAFTINMWLA